MRDDKDSRDGSVNLRLSKRPFPEPRPLNFLVTADHGEIKPTFRPLGRCLCHKGYRDPPSRVPQKPSSAFTLRLCPYKSSRDCKAPASSTNVVK